MKRRVVITGVGVLSPIGKGKEEFVKALLSGKSGIELIQSFDTSDYRTNKGGEIKNFNAADYSDVIKGIEKLGRATQLTLVATTEALEDSGYQITIDNCQNVGCILGSSEGETHFMDEYITAEENGSNEEKRHQLVPKIPSAAIYQELADRLGIHGQCATIATACAAGTNAVGYAADLIRFGIADMMIAGGVDVFSRLSFSGFNALMSVTKTCCKPFNQNRDGMILGEAAAIMILESLDSAIQRGADIYAEVLAYGISNDAYHITSPDPNGGGAKRSINSALNDAKVSADQVEYINAHGTGTQSNDIMEVQVIRELFNQPPAKIPVSASKSMVGHTLGAAGAIESLICTLAIKNNFLPPTINFVESIEGYEDIDFVPNESRPAEIKIALSNSFAFAGNASSILIGKYQS
jgi:3-oxoacyl-[acyl-carrier-protein] synthase II